MKIILQRRVFGRPRGGQCGSGKQGYVLYAKIDADLYSAVLIAKMAKTRTLPR